MVLCVEEEDEGGGETLCGNALAATLHPLAPLALRFLWSRRSQQAARSYFIKRLGRGHKPLGCASSCLAPVPPELASCPES